MRAGELVGIGIVDDDFTVARQRGDVTVRREANGTRQLHGAVFVGIFQTRIDDDWRRGAVETLLEIFFGDAGDRHEQVL